MIKEKYDSEKILDGKLQNQVDISNIKSGFYFLKITDVNVQEIKNFIKN
jgi:hypothetical protein